MQSTASNTMAAPAISSAGLWTGRMLSGLVILFLVFDSAIKLVPLQVVADTTAQLGWPTDDLSLRLLGIILLACTLLYVYPRTAVLGAVLLTAYLGGAVATHARIGSPLLTHTFFGVYVGLAVWGSLWLRNPHLRRLLIPSL
ncbi:DoxX family protein [Microvirga sp. ACRRW]|uniref:DoxX family protein n=1 Tax=Microvirga sp. ACRRW TaxID=2918205 RepID=UPI001EF5597D|nr:DoxX family protein [Microvirga sp. ACRRW]MCG7392993.1 DoxX family protein [Microvirga sp. ACRRW]